MRKPNRVAFVTTCATVALTSAAGLVIAGVGIGQHLDPDAPAEVAIQQTEPACREAADQMYGLTYRMLGEVIRPITFDGATPETITPALDAVMDAHERLYWTSLRDCHGLPRPEFAQ